MSKPEGYVSLDEDLERAAKASAPPQFAPHGGKVHHAPSLLSLQTLTSAIPKLPGEDPVLTEAAEAFAEDAQHKSPMLDGGDLPLRALAQGLSMLSLDELRRLRLPAMPWQAGDGPSMWEGLKKTPWKAHYTNFMGFLISTGARRAARRPRRAARALTAAAHRCPHRAPVGGHRGVLAGRVCVAGTAARPRCCAATARAAAQPARLPPRARDCATVLAAAPTRIAPAAARSSG